MGVEQNISYGRVRGGVGGFYPTPSSDSSPTKDEHQTEFLCMVLKLNRNAQRRAPAASRAANVAAEARAESRSAISLLRLISNAPGAPIKNPGNLLILLEIIEIQSKSLKFIGLY